MTKPNFPNTPKMNFPRRGDDGSFCVEICLKVSGDCREEMGPQIQHWLDEDWMKHRSTWKRVWKTGPNLARIDEQIHHYDDEFMKPPKVISCEGSELRFRLLGRRSAKFWRDWLVSRLLPDLRAQFPEVGERLHIEDCGE